MSKAMAAGGFVVAIFGAALASGTWTPVAYGLSEATPSVSGAGWLGTITAIAGSLTGFWNLFKQSGGGSLIQDLGGVLNSPQTPTTITAEIALVTLAGICVKSQDVENLTKVGELAKSMLVKK